MFGAPAGTSISSQGVLLIRRPYTVSKIDAQAVNKRWARLLSVSLLSGSLSEKVVSVIFLGSSNIARLAPVKPSVNIFRIVQGYRFALRIARLAFFRPIGIAEDGLGREPPPSAHP